jgi:hypothetical protein
MSQLPHSPAVVQARFQCTYDDFREANLGHIAGMQGGKKLHLWRALVAWLLFAVLGMFYVFLLEHGPSGKVAEPSPAPAPTGWPLAVRFAKAVAPSLVLFIVFGWAGIRSVLRPPAEPWMPKRTTAWGRMTKSLVFGGLAAIVFFLLFSLSSAPGQAGATNGGGTPSTAPRLYEDALALSGWLFMVVLTLSIAAANRGPAIRHRWARQTFLHRPYTLEASDAGLVLNEPQARLQYRWEYFPGFRETNHLLLLYVSPYGFWPIAKRGFATTGDLEYFKGLLLTHVRNGTFLPLQQQAFPVVLTPGRAPGLQPAAPPPIPPQPPPVPPLDQPEPTTDQSPVH